VKTRDRVLWCVFIPLAGLATYPIGPYLYDAALVALAAAVSSGDEAVRQIASHSLECLGPQAKPAIPPLRAALHHEDKAVRDAARETLQEIESEVAGAGRR
jgi:HEAT repeat protein